MNAKCSFSVDKRFSTESNSVFTLKEFLNLENTFHLRSWSHPKNAWLE